MLTRIYVDSKHGNDSFSGELDAPVRTLSYAYTQVNEGGIIVLQTGDGTSYGSLSITKNLTLSAAYGASPAVGALDIEDAQCFLEGLSFSDLEKAISVENTYIGSVSIRGCRFENTETAIKLKNVNYISIHQCFFKTFVRGILIDSAEEIVASSNIFTQGFRSIEIATVQRLDLWRNTIYGASTIASGINPDENLRVIYRTLTNFQITNKRLQLPGVAAATPGGGYDIAMNVVNGPSFGYGKDYVGDAFGSMVSWDGYQLENELAAGDMVRVMYSEDQDPGGGDAVRLYDVADGDSRFDSNSVSGRVLGGGAEFPIGIGVFLNTPVKIRYNNFDLVDDWWDGTAPSGATGLYNIGETALYRDPNYDDFRLQPDSPNIDRGDYGRWSGIYSEMGIIKVDGQYTGSGPSTRTNVAPFGRDLDFDMFHRGATGIQGETGDIGAWEFNHHETALGDHVDEWGYDKAYPGTETGPYASIDRGYRRAGSSGLYVDTDIIPYSESGLYIDPISGTAYGRHRSKDIDLSNSLIHVGGGSGHDAVYVYSSYPSFETGMVYVSPDGKDTDPGTSQQPYRTITRALQDGVPYVLVEPGFYPPFQGVTGIGLIGLDKTKDVSFDDELYSDLRDGPWTGTGTYTIYDDRIKLEGDTDILSNFTFYQDFSHRMKITSQGVTGIIRAGLENPENSAYVVLDPLTQQYIFGYCTRFYGESGLSTYEIYEALTGADLGDLLSDVKTSITLTSGKLRFTIKSAYLSNAYQASLGEGYTGAWRASYRTSDTEAGVYYDVDDIYLKSDLFSGVTGILGTQVRHKVFAIQGDTGLQV